MYFIIMSVIHVGRKPNLMGNEMDFSFMSDDVCLEERNIYIESVQEFNFATRNKDLSSEAYDEYNFRFQEMNRARARYDDARGDAEGEYLYATLHNKIELEVR